MTARYSANKQPFAYTVAHWCATEGRFRRHIKRIKETDTAGMVHIEDMLLRLNQSDVVNRRYVDPEHRSHIPDFMVYILAEDDAGKQQYLSISRQMVLFCVERRKAWRMLQSKAGITNQDYLAQKALLDKVDRGEIPLDSLLSQGRELLEKELVAGT